MKDTLDAEGAPAPASIAPRIKVSNLNHDYVSDRTGLSNPVLRDIDLSIAPGDFVSIVGPSGCGKSTLLTLMAGLSRPSSGVIEVDSLPVTGVRRDVGFVFQRDALLPWRTAVENVELALKYRGVAKAVSRAEAMRWLDQFGLAGLADRYPREMSGGQRKRVAIAATLVYKPSVLMMDEPFSALDVQTRDEIETDVLNAWAEAKNQTIVFVTHDLEEAISMSDRILLMSRGPGRIVGDYRIDLPRPRSLSDIKTTKAFQELRSRIWEALKQEVLAARQRQAAV